MDFMEFKMFFKENGSIDFHIDDSEGEVRQFIGEGWSIGRPNSESIKKTRARLRKVTEEIAYPDPGAAPKKKAKKAGVPHAVGELDSGVPESPAAPELFKYLADQAARSQDKGLQDFYGCSKCRWILTGCIACHPQKLMDHAKAFPEKYTKKPGQKVALALKVECERALTEKELTQS